MTPTRRCMSTFGDAAFSATAVVETVTCAAVIAIYVLDNRAARSLPSRDLTLELVRADQTW